MFLQTCQVVYANAPILAIVESATNNAFEQALIRPRAIQLPEIRFGNRVFHLEAPIDVEVSYEAGWVFVDGTPLPISAGSHNLDSALRSFSEDFAVLWDTIGCDSNEMLSVDARELKALLRSVVKDVAIAA